MEPKHTTFVLGLGEPKHMTSPHDEGKDGQVSEEMKDAALDVAKALGLDHEKLDAEELALALEHFDQVCDQDDDEEHEDKEHEDHEESRI